MENAGKNSQKPEGSGGPLKQELLSEERAREESYILRLLFRTGEGRSLLGGILLWVCYFIWLAGIKFVSAPAFWDLLSLTGISVVFGRLVGLYGGYALRMDYAEVLFVNLYIETALLLVVFPLISFSMKKAVQAKFAQRFVEYMIKNAKKNQQQIERFGAPGLFLLILFPFWTMGSIAGSAVGLLMRLDPLFNLALVLCASFGKIILWHLALLKFHVTVSAMNKFAPYVILAAIALAAALWYLTQLVSMRKEGRRVQ